MIKTMKDYEKTLDKVVQDLVPAEKAELLNAEGTRTIEALTALSSRAVFYDDFEEFANDDIVQRVFSLYGDCRKVKTAKHSLEICIKNR